MQMRSNFFFQTALEALLRSFQALESYFEWNLRSQNVSGSKFRMRSEEHFHERSLIVLLHSVTIFFSLLLFSLSNLQSTSQLGQPRQPTSRHCQGFAKEGKVSPKKAIGLVLCFFSIFFFFESRIRQGPEPMRNCITCSLLSFVIPSRGESPFN